MPCVRLPVVTMTAPALISVERVASSAAHVVVAQHLERALGAPGGFGHEQHGFAGRPPLTHLGDPVSDASMEMRDRLRGHVVQRLAVAALHVERREQRAARETGGQIFGR